MLGEPAFIPALHRGDPKCDTLLAEQGVAAVAAAERPDLDYYYYFVLVTGFGHTIELQAPISTRYARGLRRTGHTLRCVRGDISLENPISLGKCVRTGWERSRTQPKDQTSRVSGKCTIFRFGMLHGHDDRAFSYLERCGCSGGMARGGILCIRESERERER